MRGRFDDGWFFLVEGYVVFGVDVFDDMGEDVVGVIED